MNGGIYICFFSDDWLATGAEILLLDLGVSNTSGFFSLFFLIIGICSICYISSESESITFLFYFGVLGVSNLKATFGIGGFSYALGILGVIFIVWFWLREGIWICGKGTTLIGF